MGHWKNSNINLGVIKAGKPKKVVFQGLPNIPTITNIYPYCGCTSPKYDEKTKELTVIYNNGTIPQQVKGAQSISKRIDITYATGVIEVLTIKAVKVR